MGENSNRIYFKVVGGEAHLRIENLIEQQVERLTAWLEFKNKVGASKCYGSSGLEFDAGPPKGWVNSRQGYRPRKGSALFKEFSDLRDPPNSEDLARAINVNPVFQNYALLLPSLETIGVTRVVGIPVDQEGSVQEPIEECERLLMSEYWTLKERAVCSSKEREVSHG